MAVDQNRKPPTHEVMQHYGAKLAHGKGKWFTLSCDFHGGGDSMRVNAETGGWCCMACEKKGGDSIAYLMELEGIGFVEAAKKLDCWVDDGKSTPTKPASFSARQALEVLAIETNIVVVTALSVAAGHPITQVDKDRLIQAARRVQFVSEGML